MSSAHFENIEIATYHVYLFEMLVGDKYKYCDMHKYTKRYVFVVQVAWKGNKTNKWFNHDFR